MTRRSQADIAADLEARASKLRAESDRRLSTATDPVCSYLWDAECALHRARLVTTDDKEKEDLFMHAGSIRSIREYRWAGLKTKETR